MNFRTISLLLSFGLILPIEGLCSSQPLDLQAVVNAALIHNHNLQINRINPQIEKNTVIAEESVFDTVIGAEGASSKRVTEEMGQDTESVDYSISGSLAKKFSYGTDLSLTVERVETDVDTSAGQGDGSSNRATLVITQPLLKNRGSDINSRSLSLARDNLAIADLSLRQSVIDTIAQAKTLYWQYYYSLAFLDVQRQSLQLVLKSLEEMEERIRLGTSAKLDLLQSQSEVASREESVILSENAVRNAQDELLNYIYGRIITDESLLLADPPDLSARDVDEEALIDTALRIRTDALSAAYRNRSAETDVVYFENQKLLQLDVNATLGINDGKGDSVLTQMQTDTYEDYRYGMLSFSLALPVGQRNDEAGYAKAVLKKRQSQIDQDNIRSQIIIEVRTALRDMQASYKRYKAALLASKYAEEALRIEEEKYQSGLSTNYLVLLFQRDLTDARAREIDAISDYQISLINLNKATGITLEKNNIILEGTR